MKHFRQVRNSTPSKHPAVSAEEQPIRVQYQCLNKGAHTHNFRVFTVPSTQPPLDTHEFILQQFLQFNPHPEVDRTKAPSNPRLISSWLSKTPFLALCRNRPVAECMQLVSAPQAGEPELENLGKAVRQWSAEANSLLESTHMFVRRTLNTDDHTGYALHQTMPTVPN
jgi:hypothetical protein